MKRDTKQFWERIYIANRQAQVAREQIRAENRAQVARIQAHSNMYCTDVDARVGHDMAATARYSADAGRCVALAQMAGETIRARGDLLIQASRERCEQIRTLSLQAHAARKALASGDQSPAQKAEWENDLRSIGRLQRELMTEARVETRRHTLPSGNLLALPETQGYPT